MLNVQRMFLLLLALAALACSAAWAAANVAVENILVSKVNGITTVQLWPACSMRYLDHSPFDAGTEVRVRVNVGPDCDAVIGEVASEHYAPPSLHMANVEEIVFDQLSPRDIYITFRFSEPQKFEVRQHSVGWIEVYVDTVIDSATLPAEKAAPLPIETPPKPARLVKRTTPARLLRPPNAIPPQVEPSEPAKSLAGTLPPGPRPATLSQQAPSPVGVAPSSHGDFVVQLGVFDDSGAAEQGLSASASPHFAYRTELVVNGRKWHGLQLGFFDSESMAEQVANEMRDRFPDAWVRYVDPNEASLALSIGDMRSSILDAVAAVSVQPDAVMTLEQLTALMADGRRALLDRRYADAVDTYTRVLEVPDHQHRAESREMLGIAFERGGQTDKAIAEYRAFADEFPANIGTARVNERRSALETASSTATMATQQEPTERSRPDAWQIHGGLSHYYWRNQEQLVHDGNYLVTSSGVLGLGDVTVSRRGQRFELLGRLNGAYQHNLIEYDDTGDIGWVSDAFVDVLDNKLGLQGRVGRQTRRNDGVLGRFDGIGLRYQWKPDIFLSVSTGVPVDSPRYIGNGDRFFYAASASVEDLWDGRIAASAYTHQQSVDGVSDRQAIGGEVSYRGDSLSVFSLLDFDVAYSVLNSALVNATWHLDNGWSVSGRVDFGAEPYLTTRSALSGQTVNSIEALQDFYTEGQIRTIARNRTTQATTASLGLSAPLGDRFDLSLDATIRQADASIESAGVVARPNTGNEMFWNATLAATSLFRDNDLLLVSLRHYALQSRNSARLMIDSRLPLTRSLRISPRLIVTHHENIQSGKPQTIVTPSLRLLLRWRSVFLDVEAGGRWSSRELPSTELDPFTPDGTEELSGGYINVGYRWEF